MNSGIYLIECNRRKYVGQSVNVLLRWKNHVKRLKKGKHSNSYMQNLWNKYGEENFKFSILEYCEIDKLNEKEIYYISFLNTMSPNGMNLQTGGNSGLPSEETKRKIGDAHRGKVVSDETRKKMSNVSIGRQSSFKGKHHSEESKKKLSQSKKGKPSPLKGISIWKNKVHPFLGKKHSKETIEKLKNHKKTEECKRKLSEVMIGRKHKNSSSKYFGVFMVKDRKGNTFWQSRVKIRGKRIHLGTYSNEGVAAKKYNDYVIENNLPNPLNTLEE